MSTPTPEPEAMRAWRARHGLSQYGAAALMGTRQSMYWKWEHGETRMAGPARQLWTLLQEPEVLALARRVHTNPHRGEKLKSEEESC